MTIDRRPRRLDRTGDFVGIACGAFHNLALNSAGECCTWGINDFGRWAGWRGGWQEGWGTGWVGWGNGGWVDGG